MAAKARPAPKTAKPINLGYEPREPFIDYHNRKQRWAVIVAHRRAGKTVACILDLLDAALRCPRKNPRFAYVAPLLKQAKATAWTYLQDYTKLIPGATVNQNELRADFPNGGQVRLYGGDNPDSLRGQYFDGVVLDEYGDMHPKLFPSVIRPALADRQGWATFIGTPKGPNAFHELWQRAKGDPDYYSLMLRASSSGILDRYELEDARHQSSSPEEYAREFECSFAAASVGVYYGREMEQASTEERIASKVYDVTHQVHTAWDLGASDMTVIWFFQKVGMQVRLVDYYSNSGYGLDHYAKVLQDRNYKYGQHYFPHDVEQTHIGAGTIAHSRKQTLTNLGVNVSVVPKHSIEDGINAVRKLLPKCVFDRDKCAEGIQALQLYHRKFDDERKVFLEKPFHDWTSHPADAFRYLALSINEQVPLNKPPSWVKKAKDRLGWIV
jgi:phage terminase large subunit